MRKPRHDQRHKGPRGDSARTRGVIVHCTVSNQLQGTPTDRHRVVDFLSGSRGLSVPVVTDNDGSTEMVPEPYHGEHAACIDGCFGVEMIGQATWTRKVWLTEYRETVRNMGQWAAYWLAEVMDVAVTERNLKRLVVGHDRDHVFGGCSDHWDPGTGFPWDVMRADAIAYAKQVGYRVVAVKGERRVVRRYRASMRRRAYAWARKRIRAGWRVTIQRKPLARGDLA